MDEYNKWLLDMASRLSPHFRDKGEIFGSIPLANCEVGFTFGNNNFLITINHYNPLLTPHSTFSPAFQMKYPVGKLSVYYSVRGEGISLTLTEDIDSGKVFEFRKEGKMLDVRDFGYAQEFLDLLKSQFFRIIKSSGLEAHIEQAVAKKSVFSPILPASEVGALTDILKSCE